MRKNWSLYFTLEKIQNVEFVKDNFINTLYQIQQPITENIASRIKLEFIDNRSLSPVDMGGR